MPRQKIHQKKHDHAPAGRVQEKVRLDKWLWAARFFKTRALAQEAIEGGKVHYNGERSKPGRLVQEGATIEVTQDPYRRTLVVRGLDERRGPASRARQLYEETPESIAAREALAEQRRFLAASAPAPAHRPSKKDRRRIVGFTGKGE
jgi:ribosome-associated heat shock protein Hsp15